MSRKKRSKTEDQIRHGREKSSGIKTDREKEIMNSIANTSIILMSTMMGGLAEVMVNATGAMASGMSEALGGKEAGEKVDKEFKQKLPEVNDKMRTMISDVRKDLYVQLSQKKREIEPFLSDPAFDTGPKIIKKYDFKLPKLTEELDDSTLAQYTQLLVSEDSRFAKMFKGLVNWMNTLPKFPEKTNKAR